MCFRRLHIAGANEATFVNRKEIIYWRDKYNNEARQYVTGLEEELREKFRKYGKASKEDIQRIIRWKFQGRLTGRQKMNLARTDKVDGRIIEKVTELAFEVSGDRLRLKLLTVLDGVGYSVASVILTFLDPMNYGVLDFHAWHGLFKEDKKIFIEKDCLRFLDKLRKESQQVGLPCRDIEKAAFKKDLDGG